MQGDRSGTANQPRDSRRGPAAVQLKHLSFWKRSLVTRLQKGVSYRDILSVMSTDKHPLNQTRIRVRVGFTLTPSTQTMYGWSRFKNQYDSPQYPQDSTELFSKIHFQKPVLAHQIRFTQHTSSMNRVFVSEPQPHSTPLPPTHIIFARRFIRFTGDFFDTEFDSVELNFWIFSNDLVMKIIEALNRSRGGFNCMCGGCVAPSLIYVHDERTLSTTTGMH